MNKRRAFNTKLLPLICVTAAISATQAHAELSKLSVINLQPKRVTENATDTTGAPISLIDLNPTIGRWYVLQTGSSAAPSTLHLETPDGVTLKLDPSGALLATHSGQTIACTIDGKDSVLSAAQIGLPFSPACKGAVWVRNAAEGHRSLLEAATEALRATGGAGEFVINFYKNNFNNTAQAATYGLSQPVTPATKDGPPAATLAAGWTNRSAAEAQLDIALDNAPLAGMRLGTWYPAHDEPGIFASVLTPEAAGASTEPGRANQAYFVAWDMARFALHYTVGTAHPALGWSDRAPAPHIGPGPDGFEDATPLARVGMVPTYERSLLAGTFAGGFKREHGAFRTGENVGLHYGFAEDGVVLSKLQPGMMTFYAGPDGQPHMKTFTAADAANGAKNLLFARQTGYSLMEDGKAGPHVGDINGNWSGSNEGHLLTMRSGACVLPANGTTYLVYGVFSAATPTAMAISFQSMGCRDAAMLDMNNPVLVYSAIYHQVQGALQPERLIKPMAKTDEGGKLKFVDQPDSRDFFYLLRRSAN